jgi:hypothetical protein
VQISANKSWMVGAGWGGEVTELRVCDSEASWQSNSESTQTTYLLRHSDSLLWSLHRILVYPVCDKQTDGMMWDRREGWGVLHSSYSLANHAKSLIL